MIQVLIVENNPERIAWFQAQLLRYCRLGHAVEWLIASTPYQAIQFLRWFRPHVVFLDYDLNNGKGHEVAWDLVKRRKVHRPRIVVHSMNFVQAPKMVKSLREHGGFEVAYVPFMKLRRRDLPI